MYDLHFVLQQQDIFHLDLNAEQPKIKDLHQIVSLLHCMVSFFGLCTIVNYV